MAQINEKVFIGSVDAPTLAFDHRQIESIICNNSVNLIGDELSSDTLEVIVFFDDSGGTLRGTEYGTSIFYYSNDHLVGKYYVSEVERKGIRRYLIRATSLIGLIAKEDFYGGFYSGETFEDVTKDILLTDGLDLTKYRLYTPLSVRSGTAANTNPRGVQVLFKDDTVEYVKYRIHLEFEIIGCYYAQSCDIAGAGMYLIDIKSTDGLSFSIRLFYRDLFYAALELSSSKIGVGSKITVDINPLAGTAYMSAQYVNPEDSSDTGFLEVSAAITIPTGSITAYNLNKAYGYSQGTWSYSYQLRWTAFKVWDENSVLILDAIFAATSDGTKNYVINKCTGYKAETPYFEPYGESLGVFGSFDRIERDVELTKSIVFEENVAGINVYGWLDVGTRRDALHKMLFAHNVCMLKSDDGGVLFTTLSKQTAGSIADENLYDDSAEKNMPVAKNINITENTYEESGTSQVLFDNTNSPLISNQYIAMLDKAPIYGTPVGNGITILYSNCNAALVTGRGTITGTPYVHSKHVIKYSSGNAPDGSDISVSNIGLITGRNSDNIMNKLKAYYSGAVKKVSNSFRYGGEKCGLKYVFKTLYSAINEAFLTKINARSSSFVKANCEFIAGYIPPTGSGYTDYLICAYNERWDVPASVHDKEYPVIRLNIIGKGHDGTAGAAGSDGSLSDAGKGRQSGGEGGAGGAGGTGGDGGLVYSVAVDAADVSYLTVEQSAYNTVVKTYDSGDTLLGTYSSATGNKSDDGFLNIFNGLHYARRGQDGIAGGSGGKGGTVWRKNMTEIDLEKPEAGDDAGVYSGGTSHTVEVLKQDEYGVEYYYYNSYGGGGGAAYGANGGNSAAVSRIDPRIVTIGGSGAAALIPQNPYTEYGSGGFGGHGGGGGGGAGTLYKWPNLGSTFDSGQTTSQRAGAGGAGSAGTPGIDGCCIIYF